MKTKSKILILFLTLALLCGILFVSASAADETEHTTGFEMTVGDAAPEYIADGSPEKLSDTLANAKAGRTKIKLYQNYSCEALAAFGETKSAFAKITYQDAIVELDLNGHSLTEAVSLDNAVFYTTQKLYVYSTKAGASLLTASGINTPIFTAAGAGAELHVGYAPDAGTTVFPLTIEAATIAKINGSEAKVNLKQITYNAKYARRNGAFDLRGSSAAVNMTNCTLNLGTSQFPLFYAYNTSATNFSATIAASSINATATGDTPITAADGSVTNKVGTVTMTGTDLVSSKALTCNAELFPVTLSEGVRLCEEQNGLSLAEGYSYAHIDEVETLKYGVVNQYATINFKDGDSTLATQKWAVGSTPKYEHAFSEQEEGDYVLKPSGKWNIPGITGALPESSAGQTLDATPEYEKVAKAFEVVTDGGKTIYTDTDFNKLKTALEGVKVATKIKLYRDYEVKTGVVIRTAVTVDLDLNGHSLTTTAQLNNGIIRTSAENLALYVYSTAQGAQISDSQGGVLFVVGNGKLYVGQASDSAVTTERLKVTGNIFVKMNGAASNTADVAKVDYINEKARTAGVFQLQNAGGSVKLSDCTFALQMPLFYELNAVKTLDATVNNSKIYTTSGQLATTSTSVSEKNGSVAMNNTEIYSKVSLSYSDMLNTVTLDGNAFVSARINEVTVGTDKYYYTATDANNTGTVTFKVGTEEVSETWKQGETPVYSNSAFDTYYWYAKATKAVVAGDTTSYDATLKTTESKITGNLTLYANITFNLYFRNDGFINGVTYTHPDGKTKINVTFENKDLVTLSDGDYYLFKIDDISPKDLSEAFTLEVNLKNGETAATYTVKTSLVKYATAVLADEKGSESGKKLVVAILDYVREMSAEFSNKTVADPGFKAITDRLDTYKALLSDTKWDKSTTSEDLKKGNITAASLKLASTPGFIFFLDSTKYATAETVEVTINGVTKSYKVTTVEGSDPYIIVGDIYVSNYTNALTVELEGHKITYSFDLYMAYTKSQGEIPAYLNAFYRYILAAQAYLGAQGN